MRERVGARTAEYRVSVCRVWMCRMYLRVPACARELAWPLDPSEGRVLASLGSECANTVYKLPHVRIRVIASGTVRRCAERLTPSVQTHPELFTPDGCGSPLPGRTMPPAPRPRMRAARAAGLGFLRGLVCEPEVVVSHIPFARAVFLRRRLRATRRQRGRVVPDLGLRTEA